MFAAASRFHRQSLLNPQQEQARKAIPTLIIIVGRSRARNDAGGFPRFGIDIFTRWASLPEWTAWCSIGLRKDSSNA
jgi:hypothetical protein